MTSATTTTTPASPDVTIIDTPGIDTPGIDTPGSSTPITDLWLERDRAVIAPVLSRVHDIVAVEGRGSWLTDVDGRRYLDLTCGIAVTNLGHCHPEVVAAAERQLHALVHTSVVVHNPHNIELAERIGQSCPFFRDPQVFFSNSGTEAVEGAIKLARKVTGRPGIIAFRGGFHGRTMGSVAITTAKDKYREGYEPLMAGVGIAPYAYPLRAGGDPATRAERATADALAALDALLADGMHPSTVAAMIVEPMLGEGGYVPAPAAWLQGLRDRCDRYGILLVLDEVQTGFGRTGAMFAAQRLGVRPDVLLFAKGVANGLPLGGIVAESALMARWPTATHGTTFGGNPVSCAAAIAVIDVIERDHLCERARHLGAQLVDRLARLEGELPGVVEVRGLGLMIGVELARGDQAHAVQAQCRDDGLLLLTCGPGENVLRLIPPLTISDDDAELALSILERALRSHCR